jgi:acyl-CoA synthetase (AMP-forming)/AMP-acid ligase II
MTTHLLEMSSSKTCGTRTADNQEATLSIRYYDWIAHFSRRTPDKTALIDLASQRRFSYSQLDARISRLAAHLRDVLKIARGDRVAVLRWRCSSPAAGLVPSWCRSIPALPFPNCSSSPATRLRK